MKNVCIAFISLILLLVASGDAFALSGSRSLILPPTGVFAKGIVNGQSPASEVFVYISVSVTSRLDEEGLNVDVKSDTCLRTSSGGTFNDINCSATAEDNTVSLGCEYCVNGFVFGSAAPGPFGQNNTITIPDFCKTYNGGRL